MEVILQMAGVVVPTVTALGGMFAWGIRRMDRRFDEARRERKRLESRIEALESRMDALEARMDALVSRMDALESRMDALEGRMDGLESRVDRLEVRVDRMGEQLGAQITVLNREMGKLQGFTGAAQVPSLVTS